MSESMQIVFMQARIARIASECWHMSIAETARVLKEHNVFQHIEDCFELYHLEGDEAVWEDLQPYLL